MFNSFSTASPHNPRGLNNIIINSWRCINIIILTAYHRNEFIINYKRQNHFRKNPVLTQIVLMHTFEFVFHCVLMQIRFENISDDHRRACVDFDFMGRETIFFSATLSAPTEMFSRMWGRDYIKQKRSSLTSHKLFVSKIPKSKS